MFFDFGALLTMYIFEVVTFYLVKDLSNQLIFLVVVCIYKIHDSDEAFSLLAIVTLMTEKMSFSYFHGNIC